MDDTPIIKCPKCSAEIHLTEALTLKLKESLRAEAEVVFKKRELEAKNREDDLKKRAARIEEEKRSLDKVVDERVGLERIRLKREAERRAKEDSSLELKGLKEENAEKQKKLDEMMGKELELRKKAVELENDKKAFELQVARRLDEERQRVREESLRLFSEEHRLKDIEKDKKMSDMHKTIEELNRKLTQGSIQAQGEVMELEMEGILKSRFPFDSIEPVPKGVKGADVLQRVFDNAGRACGVMIWEVKNTKAWDDKWIGKLKDDQRNVGASIAVIVTETLPRGVNGFSNVNGVWVSSTSLALSVASVLREGLIEAALSKLSVVNRTEKMEAIYAYLSGPEFRHRIEGIVEAFKSIKDDLEHEKRAMGRLWAKREKQIERVMQNTIRMHGDFHGIIGSSMPEIKSLELAGGDIDAEDAS